jgi:hypothetical protein
MSFITLEPGTRSVKRPVVDKDRTDRVVYEHLYYEGRVQIRIFDDTDTDGISLEMFKRALKRKGETILLHEAFEIKDKDDKRTTIPGRKVVYHGNGEFEFHKEQLGSTKYSISEDIVKAFGMVSDETIDNLPELEKLKTATKEKNNNGVVYGPENTLIE